MLRIGVYFGVLAILVCLIISSVFPDRMPVAEPDGFHQVYYRHPGAVPSESESAHVWRNLVSFHVTHGGFEHAAATVEGISNSEDRAAALSALVAILRSDMVNIGLVEHPTPLSETIVSAPLSTMRPVDEMPTPPKKMAREEMESKLKSVAVRFKRTADIALGLDTSIKKAEVLYEVADLCIALKQPDAAIELSSKAADSLNAVNGWLFWLTHPGKSEYVARLLLAAFGFAALLSKSALGPTVTHYWRKNVLSRLFPDREHRQWLGMSAEEPQPAIIMPDAIKNMDGHPALPRSTAAAHRH